MNSLFVGSRMFEYADEPEPEEVKVEVKPDTRKRKASDADIASRVRYVRQLLHDADYEKLDHDQLIFLGFRCETDFAAIDDHLQDGYHGAQGDTHEYWIPPPNPDTLDSIDLSQLPGIESIRLPRNYDRNNEDKPPGICIYGTCVEPAVPVEFKDTVYSKMCKRDAEHYLNLFQ